MALFMRREKRSCGGKKGAMKGARRFKCVFYCVVIPTRQRLTSAPQSRGVACIGCDTATLCMTGHWKFQTCHIYINAEYLFFGDECVASPETPPAQLKHFTPHNFITLVLKCLFCVCVGGVGGSVWFCLVLFVFCAAHRHVAVFDFQVEEKSKTEVSLLDLDDCEFICTFTAMNHYI